MGGGGRMVMLVRRLVGLLVSWSRSRLRRAPLMSRSRLATGACGCPAGAANGDVPPFGWTNQSSCRDLMPVAPRGVLAERPCRVREVWFRASVSRGSNHGAFSRCGHFSRSQYLSVSLPVLRYPEDSLLKRPLLLPPRFTFVSLE